MDDIKELSYKILRLAYDHEKEYPGGSFPISPHKARDLDIDISIAHKLCEYLEAEKSVTIEEVVREIGGPQLVMVRIKITASGSKIVENKFGVS